MLGPWVEATPWSSALLTAWGVQLYNGGSPAWRKGTGEGGDGWLWSYVWFIACLLTARMRCAILKVMMVSLKQGRTERAGPFNIDCDFERPRPSFFDGIEDEIDPQVKNMSTLSNSESALQDEIHDAYKSSWYKVVKICVLYGMSSVIWCVDEVWNELAGRLWQR